MDNKRVEELVLQSLEQEIEGERIYDTALECAVNTDLRNEWAKYLDETKMHVAALMQVCEALSIDPDKETTGRAVVRHVGAALEEAMKLAQSGRRCDNRGVGGVRVRGNGRDQRPPRAGIEERE